MFDRCWELEVKQYKVRHMTGHPVSSLARGAKGVTFFMNRNSA